MADTAVPVQTPAVQNTFLDASGPITTGFASAVVRERMAVADDSDPSGIARVEAVEPDTGDYGLVVRPVRQGLLSDFGGTIAAGATAQSLLSPNPLRRFLLIQNLDPTEDLWIDFTATAVVGSPSIMIPHAGGEFRMDGAFVSTEAVSIIATTTAHAFAAKEG